MKLRLVFLCGIFFLSSSYAEAPKKGAAFLFFGDFGTGGESQKLVAKGMKAFCALSLCEFVVGLGDNFYPKGVTSTTDPKWKTHFQDPYGPLDLDFYPALGNHDYDGNVTAQLDYSKQGKHWQMPAAFFSFSRGNIEFFAIDTNKFDETEIRWLQHALMGSQATWKIVFGHHPIYSYGQHGDTPELVEKLLPILIKTKTDFYLSGHDHDLQVINGYEGLAMVISGAAAQVRPAKKGARTEFVSSHLGFAHMETSSTTATLRLLDQKGKEIFKKNYKK